VRSFQDYTIFNSVNPNALEPKPKKSLPFPLENLDAEVADIYAKVDRLKAQLEAAKENPVNKTPAKQKRLTTLLYKTKTCLKFLQDISNSSQELWF
jgi:hypothetical protein